MSQEGKVRPVSRRKFIRAAAITSGGLALAVCAPRSTPAQAIKRGGQLVASKQWTYASLDPHLTSEPEMAGYDALFNTLVRFELVDPKTWEHKLVGDLAESWQQPDPKTIVFKLRKGVTFHDGSEFDAAVAKWNLERQRDHPKAQLIKVPLANVGAVETPDKYTLRLKLKSDSPSLIRLLAFAWGAKLRMASKAAMEKLGDEGFARNPVGTGPFKFKQWVTDDRLILERNPNYFEMGADGKSLPYLDGLVFRYIPDPTVALVDMRAGSLHVLEWILTKDVATIKGDSNLAIWEMPWAGQIYFFGGYNIDAPPFNDVRVRQAANYGIDREGMAKALGYGVGFPYYYPQWGPAALGWDETILKYPYNPAKVKELLTAAGYPDGVSIELKVISREPELTIGEFVQQMWTAVGIKTKMVSQERLSWIDAMRAKKFQACFWRGNLAQPSVESDSLITSFTCGSPSNWAQWCDRDVDRLMKEAGAAMDPKKRHTIYREVFQLIQEKAYLFTGIAMPLMTSYRKEVQGLTFDFQSPTFHRAWLR